MILDHMDMINSDSEHEWYKLAKVNLSCPFCGVDLKWDNTSQIIAFIVFVSSFAVSYLADNVQERSIGNALTILGACMFWGSFILFFYLGKYIEQK